MSGTLGGSRAGSLGKLVLFLSTHGIVVDPRGSPHQGLEVPTGDTCLESSLGTKANAPRHRQLSFPPVSLIINIADPARPGVNRPLLRVVDANSAYIEPTWSNDGLVVQST